MNTATEIGPMATGPHFAEDNPADLGLSDRSIAFLLFGFLLSCYLFTYTGVIQSSDGLAMFSTAESLVRHGHYDSNQLLWMGQQQGTYGPDGNLYNRKGLGMTLLALPLVWLAQQWHAIGLVQSALLLVPLLTAWTGALVYRTGRRLGWPRAVALLTALAYGLATLAWPYTQTFFSDPVAGWALYAGFYGLLAFRQSGRKRTLFAGGLAWGLAYLTRAVNVVTLPLYGLGLLLILADGVKRAPTGFPSRGTYIFYSLIAERWRVWTAFALPVLVAGVISLVWNWVRFGAPLDSGYLEIERFSGHWSAGIFGLLLGPARGLLWYSPVLTLGLLGARWFWHNARWILGLVVSITAIYVVVYGKWFMWHGGYSWGPRFLVPVLPFLALLTGPAWTEVFLRPRWGRAGQILAGTVIALSLGIQWLGLAVPFGLVQDWLAQTVQPLFAPQTFSRLAYSPLYLQWRFLHRDQVVFAWWQAGLAEGWPDWLGFLLPLTGLLIGAGLIVRLVQPAGQVEATANLAPADRTRHWVYGLALCLVAVTLVVHYQPRLSDREVTLLTDRIEALERPGDAVLTLDIQAAQPLANAYHGTLPVYGLMPQATLDVQSVLWMDRFLGRNRRLWVIPDYTPPDRSGWERSLRMNSFLLLDERPAGDGGRRLALYALRSDQPWVEAGVGTVFGDPHMAGGQTTAQQGWMRLNGYGYTQRTHPGGEILVILRWQSLRPVVQDYRVFVHLLNEHGEKVAQRDGQPVQWLRPTSSWRPGEEIVDRYGLLLPATFAPGEYRIAVGLYEPAGGDRLPISAGPEDDAIELGPIQVEP